MIRKAASALALLVVVLLPSGSVALGLGGIEVSSALNEPLNARISLRSLTASDAEGMRVSLGSSEQFERAGIERPFYLSTLNFKVVEDGTGNGRIEVSTREPVNEPFLNFLVEVSWPRGRVVREYTVLLDPPVYGAAITRTANETVETVAAAPSASAAPQPAAPRQRASAPVTSPRTSSAGSPGGGNYAVQRNDTLWSIAARQRPDSSVSVQRMMLAILAANPDAFSIQNINALKAGAVLRMPTAGELSAGAQANALAEVRRQHAEWQEYRQGLAASAPATSQSASAPPAPAPSAPAPAAPATGGTGSTAPAGDSAQSATAASGTASDDGTLKLVAPGQSAAASAGEGTISEQITALRDELNMALEEADSQRRQTAELESRLGQAENLVDDLQRLVQLKDDAIAQLQAELSESQKALEQAQQSTPATSTAQSGQDVATATAGGAGAKPKSEAKPEAKKPADKPKPKKPVPPPPPPKPPSFLDTVEDMIGVDPIIAGAGLGGVLLVGIGGFALARRRRRAAEAEEAAGDSDELAAAGAAALAGEGTEDLTELAGFDDDLTELADDATEVPAGAAPDAGSDDVTELPGSADTAIQDTAIQETDIEPLTDDDPLAEVNVYLAYERYDHAESLVRDAIEQYPDRPEYRLRLLEVFHSAKNVSGFQQAAAELKDAVGEDSPLMEQAQAWWKDLEPEPDTNLFGAVAGVAAVGAVAAAGAAAADDIFDITGGEDSGEGEDTASDTSIDFDLGFEMTSDEDTQDDAQGSVDFDLGFEGGEAASEVGEASNLDFDLTGGGDGTSEDAVSETGEIDFDLSDTASDVTGSETGDGVRLDATATELPDFDLDVGDATETADDGSGTHSDLVSEFSLETAEPAGTQTGLGDDAGEIDFDLGATDELTAEEMEPPAGATADIGAESGADLDFDLGATDELDATVAGTTDGDLDFDLGSTDELAAPEADATGAGTDSGSDLDFDLAGLGDEGTSAEGESDGSGSSTGLALGAAAAGAVAAGAAGLAAMSSDAGGSDEEAGTSDELDLDLDLGADDTGSLADAAVDAKDDLVERAMAADEAAAASSDEIDFDIEDTGEMNLSAFDEAPDDPEPAPTPSVGDDGLDLDLGETGEQTAGAESQVDEALLDTGDIGSLDLELPDMDGDAAAFDAPLGADDEIDLSLDTGDFEADELGALTDDGGTGDDFQLDTTELAAAADAAPGDGSSQDAATDGGLDLDLGATGGEGVDAAALTGETSGEGLPELDLDLGLGDADDAPTALGGLDASETGELPDLDLDLGMGDADPIGGETGLGLDLDLTGDSGPDEEGTLVGDGLDLDLNFGEEEAAAASLAEGAEETGDLALDLDSAVSPAPESGTGLDLDLTLDEDLGGTGTGTDPDLETVKLRPGDVPSIDASGSAGDASTDFGIDTEFQDIFSSDDATGSATGDLDIDFDLGSDLGDDDDDSNTLVLGRSEDGGVDEVQTKLDLAQAYMDMEDFEGARGILGEVLAQGSDAQQEVARAMLGKLD